MLDIRTHLTYVRQLGSPHLSSPSLRAIKGKYETFTSKFLELSIELINIQAWLTTTTSDPSA
jgi:hypothetical protein